MTFRKHRTHPSRFRGRELARSTAARLVAPESLMSLRSRLQHERTINTRAPDVLEGLGGLQALRNKLRTWVADVVACQTERLAKS